MVASHLYLDYDPIIIDALVSNGFTVSSFYIFLLFSLLFWKPMQATISGHPTFSRHSTKLQANYTLLQHIDELRRTLQAAKEAHGVGLVVMPHVTKPAGTGNAIRKRWKIHLWSASNLWQRCDMVCFLLKSGDFRKILREFTSADKLWLVRFGKPGRISSTIYRLNMIEPSWHIGDFYHLKNQISLPKLQLSQACRFLEAIVLSQCFDPLATQHDNEAADKSGWPSKKRKRVDWMHRRTGKKSLAACFSHSFSFKNRPTVMQFEVSNILWYSLSCFFYNIWRKCIYSICASQIPPTLRFSARSSWNPPRLDKKWCKDGRRGETVGMKDVQSLKPGIQINFYDFIELFLFSIRSNFFKGRRSWLNMQSLSVCNLASLQLEQKTKKRTHPEATGVRFWQTASCFGLHKTSS